ncbi:Zn-dependent exopeptidase [Fistulina hepatica ATCC 64428]|nr:Zn-dependent exopeptidase [Fistulina hepatica ATCC 64428]
MSAVLVLSLASIDIPQSCLNYYYGSYSDISHPDEPLALLVSESQECIQNALDLATSGHIVYPESEIQRLVWIEHKDVDSTLVSAVQFSGYTFDDFLQRLSTNHRTSDADQHDQDVLTVYAPSHEVLYRSASAALLSLNPMQAASIDTLVPRFWKSKLVSSTPVSHFPVPPEAIEPVKRALDELAFNPVVASVMGNISLAQMTNDIRFLTGEDGQSGIVSRHSFADGSRLAAAWLKARFEDTGATCELKDFLIGFAPNVVCRYAAVVESNATVLLSAHYDSRGSFGSVRAPGANDDGSGAVSLLAIARTIGRKGIKFHANVELVAFAGEEQGLLGSRAYAREMRAAGNNITLMIQERGRFHCHADMLAYRSPDEPAQLGLPHSIGTPEVADFVTKVASIYSPELTVGYTTACCSDHQSFHEQGFPSTQVFERAGPIIDPMYHNSGDLSDRVGYDLEQARSIAKVQFASLLHVAGFEL